MFAELWGAGKGEKMDEEVLLKIEEVLLEIGEVLLELDTTGLVTYLK